MTRQEEILLETAKKHGISIGKARHAFYCFGKKTDEIIDNPNNIDSETGLFIPDNFKIFSVIKLGKFVPKLKSIDRRNKLKLEKDEL